MGLHLMAPANTSIVSSQMHGVVERGRMRTAGEAETQAKMR